MEGEVLDIGFVAGDVGRLPVAGKGDGEGCLCEIEAGDGGALDEIRQLGGDRRGEGEVGEMEARVVGVEAGGVDGVSRLVGGGEDGAGLQGGEVVVIEGDGPGGDIVDHELVDGEGADAVEDRAGGEVFEEIGV